jgi:hypothetical protein
VMVRNTARLEIRARRAKAYGIVIRYRTDITAFSAKATALEVAEPPSGGEGRVPPMY